MGDNDRRGIGWESSSPAFGMALTRRRFLRLASLVLSAPVVGGLLAACGGDDDDDDDDATEAPSGTTPTAAAGSPTAAASPTEADATAAASPTGAAASPTGSAGSPTTSSGNVVDGGDRLMGKQIEDAASTGGTFLEGGTQDLRTVNPIIMNDGPSYNFGFLVYEVLCETSPETLEPVGNLAASWEINADASEYTINLREGVTWHDGEPFTSADVKFTFDLHMNVESGSSFTGDFTSKIAGIETPDEATVVFTMTGPQPDFLIGITSTAQILAQHIWQDVAPADIQGHEGSTGVDPSLVVGTGPFKFQEWVPADHATAVRNDDYWDGVPHLDEYIYRIVADDTAAVQQLKTEELDVFQGIPSQLLGELEGTDLTVVDEPTFSFTILFTNLDEAVTTLFQDVEVRQAMLVALDREAMIDSIRFGFGEVAVGTMPTLSWAYNPEGIEEKYEYDPERAVQLLESAGWIPGGDGVREKDGQRLAFTMQTLSGDPTYDGYATAMQEFWREVGIEMTPEFKPLNTWIADVADAHQYEAALIGFGWTAAPDQSPMWACASYEGGFNIMKYCNPEVDELLNQALVEADQAKRIELYTAFQNALMADLPSAVIDFPRYIAAYNPRVHNYFPNSVYERFNSETWWVEG